MIKPTLLLESDENGITISLRAVRVRKRRVRAKGEVLETIDRLFRDARVTGRNLERIEVVLGPGTFSETRAVVAVANALSYALHVPLAGGVPFIAATYKSEPRITL